MSSSRGSYRGRGSSGNWRGGGRGANAAPKGAFLNGVWHCDCDPPLPAVHFPVKKDGPNKNRWFRTCQKQQDERCKFFLWDSDAHPRENAALASNSRTEPAHASTTPRAQRVVSPPSKTSETPSRKRNRSAGEDDDEFGLGPGNTAFEEELDQVMVEAETPSKKPRTDTFATPKNSTRRTLPWLTDNTPKPSELPTPQTEQRTSKDPFQTRLSTRGESMVTPARNAQDDDPSSTQGTSETVTPTPVRFKDPGSASKDADLARDVFDILREANVQLDDQTRKTLMATLSRHATIAEGVKRGRDVARTAVTAKTAKVTELTYRVNTLEAELEAEKAKVSHLQWSLENGQDTE